MCEYTVRAALHAEANEGWVWISNQTKTRQLIKITNPCKRKYIICESRNIDVNFRSIYNENNRTIEIKDDEMTIVISEWYRDALGIENTTKKDNREGKNLYISALPEFFPLSIWYQARASSHHPNAVVRLAVRLGSIGIWLGMVGIAIGIGSALPINKDTQIFCISTMLFVLFSLLPTIAIIAACRSPKFQ